MTYLFGMDLFDPNLGDGTTGNLLNDLESIAEPLCLPGFIIHPEGYATLTSRTSGRTWSWLRVEYERLLKLVHGVWISALCRLLVVVRMEW